VIRAVHPDPGGGFWLREVDEPGEPVGPQRHAATVGVDDSVRWLWASTGEVYPGLLAAGVRVDRCHDLELTEALLLGVEGQWGHPRGLAAAAARLAGLPIPPDPPARSAVPPGEAQATLFDPAPAGPAGSLADVLEVYRAQRDRIAVTPDPKRFRLLVAAESAGALLAVEMGRVGLPWRADVHEALLVDLLG
jgi:DNA polymerase I